MPTESKQIIWGDSQVIARGMEGGRMAAVSIRFESGDNGPHLSMQGVVGHPSSLRAGNADECGQIIDTIAAIPADKLVNGWTARDLAELIATWRRWHLNGMRAACWHQRERGETWTTHPSAECPECGYQLGNAWLYEPLPPEVIEWAKANTTVSEDGRVAETVL